MRFAVLASLLAVLAFAARPAAAAGADPVADTTGVLTVADPPAATVELVDLSRALRGAVAQETRGVLSADEVRQRMSGVISTATLTELDRAYAGAVAAYQSGDYEGAARTLRAVLDDLESLPESSVAYAQRSRAMLRLARTEASLGRKGESKDVLERLIRADPTVKVDPELYPPSFVRQVDEVRAAVKASPHRKLTVTSAAGPVRVFVEGREVGTAPVTVSIPAGAYRVSGVSGDTRVPPTVVDLTQEDQSLALDLSVASTYRPNAGPGLALSGEQRPKGIITAGAALKLDRVLAASLATDGDVRFLVGSLYDVRRGSLLREGRLRLSGWTPPQGGLQALSAFLVRGEESSLVIAAGKKPQLDAVPPGTNAGLDGRIPPPKVKSGKSGAVGWTAIGTLALTAGLTAYGVYEYNQGSQAYEGAKNLMLPDGTVTDQAEFDRLRSEGNKARSNAKIAGGAAIGTLTLTTVLSIWSYVDTGAIGPIRF